MSRTALLPVVLLLVCVLPFAAASRWTLVVLVLPLLAAACVLRLGVDVADQGITVRRVLGSRTVAWTELAGIRVGRRRALWLVTTAGTEIAVPVLRVGVDVDDAGITVRQLVAARTVRWSELAGIRIGRRRGLWLVTTAGTEIALPVLRAGDLPRLSELSGGRIPQPQ